MARVKPRPSQDYEKAQRVLDKIDAHQHEKELKVQEKLKASERKLEKAKKAGNAEDEEKYIELSREHPSFVKISSRRGQYG